jgi:hypothetical protein
MMPTLLLGQAASWLKRGGSASPLVMSCDLVGYRGRAGRVALAASIVRLMLFHSLRTRQGLPSCHCFRCGLDCN